MMDTMETREQNVVQKHRGEDSRGQAEGRQAAVREGATSGLAGSLPYGPVVQRKAVQFDRSAERSDRRSDRRVGREVESDRRTGRPEGGRDRSGLAQHLSSDWAGRAILHRYLTGGGDWSIINNATWSSYMMANALLARQCRDRVLARARLLAAGGGTGVIPVNEGTFPLAIENGEGIIGYQYLHGTNALAGGFQIYGTADVTRSGGASSIRLRLNYRWNDIIDPNPQYATDNWKSRLAEIITLGQAQSYQIHIQWSSETVVSINGSAETIAGWPGTGTAPPPTSSGGGGGGSGDRRGGDSSDRRQR